MSFKGVSEPVVSLRGVRAGYGVGRAAVEVLHDVDLDLFPGSTVGLVGESGSGKSTLGRVVVGQLQPSHGQVLISGRGLTALRGSALRRERRRVQLIPQDPYASLDPRMTVGRTIQEAMAPQRRLTRSLDPKVAQALGAVALDPDVADRYPSEFSGGQRQRIAIARSLSVDPEVIVADEVTSSLDASVQAEILNLLLDVQRRTKLALLFITHDLAVAGYMCDALNVLYLGRIIERGTGELLKRPLHPYSSLLVGSRPTVAILDDHSAPRAVGDQEAPDPAKPPGGCPFHPRCPRGPNVIADHIQCRQERPVLRPSVSAAGPASYVACHYPLQPVEEAPHILSQTKSPSTTD